MKKFGKLAVLLILIALSVVLCSCNKTVDYTIDFDVDGVTYATISTSGDKTIKIPDNPTKEGYSFDGWYASDATALTADALLTAPISSDMTVYAKWTVKRYTISFDSNDGSVVADIDQDYLTAVTATENPTKTGNTFIGWYTDDVTFANSYTFSTMPAEDITLFAKWTVNTNSVTFSGNGGTLKSGDEEQTIEYGCGATAPIYEKEYYTLSWDKTFDNITATTAVNAVWTANAYNVLLDQQGGDNGTESITATYDQDMPQASAPEKPGYEFGGYFSEISGGGTKYYNSDMSSAAKWNIDAATLYAYWIYIPGTEGLAYKLMKNVTAYSVSIGSCTDTEITIPVIYNDKLVSSIANEAFYGCSGLISVTIGSGVTNIGDYAFSGCSGLTSITIPDSVTNIGEYSFEGCSGLTSITIPDSVINIGNDAFYECGGLTSATLGSSVTSIGENAFYYCAGLLSVTIPDSVTNIGECAFYGCSGLTTISIPDSLTSIGYYAFNDTDWYNKQPDGVIYAGKAAYAYKGTMPYGTSITLLADTKFIADFAFYGCSNMTSIIVPDSVTSIGDCALYGCSNITSITIPADIISIGYSAFEDCSALASIIIPDSVTGISGSAFNNTEWYYNLPEGMVYAGKVACKYKGIMPDNTSITLLSGIESISNNAFYGCSGLTSITIPDSVTNIGASAFGECINLTSVTIGCGVKNICDYAFYGCSGLTSVTIPAGVTSISVFAFSRCSGLTSLAVDINNAVYRSEGNCLIAIALNELIIGCNSSVIPAGATSIGDNAFYECTELTSITIPDGVTSIGSSAFSYCRELTSVTIPDSMKYIGVSAFYYCVGLTSIIIPSGVINIDDYAFCECRNLTSITIPDSVTNIGNAAFFGCIGLTSVTIGNGVTNIGGSAFFYCTSLTSITIPDSVKKIDDGAFCDCNGLISATLGSSMTSIGNGMFYGCSALTSIIIPDSVTSIGNSAFYGCSNLNSAIFENSTGWYITSDPSVTSGTGIDVTEASASATSLRSTYTNYYWKRIA